MASALRRKDTGVITFLESGVSEGVLSHRNFLWLYAYGIKGVQSVLENSMYQMNMFTLTPQNAGSFFAKKQCDGIVTFSLGGKYLDRVKSSGLPYVMCYREPSPAYNSVYIDEIHGGYLAGEYLKNTGHVKFAHITAGIGKDQASTHRLQGFRKAIGVEPMIFEGEYGIKGGYAQGKLIARHIKENKVDGIFALNDLTCFGIIQALLENGINIPQDVSLIGYDNMPYIDSLPFKLATVELRMFDVYKTAMEALLRMIKNGGEIHQAVKPVLVKGESVLNRKKGASK